MNETSPTEFMARTDVAQVPLPFLHLHRASSALITGWARVGDDRYTATARWPSPPSGAAFDTLTLANTVRQACLLIAHAEQDVPLDQQTLMNVLNLRMHSGPRIPPEGGPVRLLVDIRSERTGPRAMKSDVVLYLNSEAVAEASLSFNWISPPAYRRLRKGHLDVDWAGVAVTPAVPEAVAGRRGTSRIALSAGGGAGQWLLRTDTTDPVLYDHPVDHVPGLVLVEASYQAAHALTGAGPRSSHRMESVFHRYVEFASPCRIEAVRRGEDIQVTGVQGGEEAFTVLLGPIA